MKLNKKWIGTSCFLAVILMGSLLSGCATTSSMEELQMKVDQALQQSQQAMEMAKGTESKCLDLKTDATEEYRAVGAAADRAERAADKSESMADLAKKSADRAEDAADKTQELYDKIMSK